MKTKQAKEAKASLEKMMELLKPFLPKPDIREIDQHGTWGLPKDCCHRGNENPDEDAETQRKLAFAAMA